MKAQELLSVYEIKNNLQAKLVNVNQFGVIRKAVYVKRVDEKRFSFESFLDIFEERELRYAQQDNSLMNFIKMTNFLKENNIKPDHKSNTNSWYFYTNQGVVRISDHENTSLTNNLPTPKFNFSSVEKDAYIGFIAQLKQILSL